MEFTGLQRGEGTEAGAAAPPVGRRWGCLLLCLCFSSFAAPGGVEPCSSSSRTPPLLKKNLSRMLTRRLSKELKALENILSEHHSNIQNSENNVKLILVFTLKQCWDSTFKKESTLENLPAERSARTTLENLGTILAAQEAEIWMSLAHLHSSSWPLDQPGEALSSQKVPQAQVEQVLQRPQNWVRSLSLAHLPGRPQQGNGRRTAPPWGSWLSQSGWKVGRGRA